MSNISDKIVLHVWVIKSCCFLVKSLKSQISKKLLMSAVYQFQHESASAGSNDDGSDELLGEEVTHVFHLPADLRSV